MKVLFDLQGTYLRDPVHRAGVIVSAQGQEFRCPARSLGKGAVSDRGDVHQLDYPCCRACLATRLRLTAHQLELALITALRKE